MCCTENGPHTLPDARFLMDSTLMRCSSCDDVFVICSIMGQGTHARHWIRYEGPLRKKV